MVCGVVWVCVMGGYGGSGCDVVVECVWGMEVVVGRMLGCVG